MSLPNPSMSFTPFDTLPASDMNDLVENIESLADGTGFDAGSIPASALASDAGYIEIARTTLSVAGDTITVNSIPNRKYLRIIINALNTGGTIDTFLRFNNDSGSNYARRLSSNGAADVTGTGTTLITFGNAAYPTYTIVDLDNISAQEKLATVMSIAQNTAGAANIPGRTVGTAKWANTASVISRVDVTNPGTGDYAIGSEVIILGKN